MQNDLGVSLCESIGGETTIRRLVEAFYPRVYAHPDLAPLFQGDIEQIKWRQRLFMTQFLGGPRLYTDSFGFTNLRSIHLGFEITPNRAQAWLDCMNGAMDEIGLSGEERALFFARLTKAAQMMTNTGI